MAQICSLTLNSVIPQWAEAIHDPNSHRSEGAVRTVLYLGRPNKNITFLDIFSKHVQLSGGCMEKSWDDHMIHNVWNMVFLWTLNLEIIIHVWGNERCVDAAHICSFIFLMQWIEGLKAPHTNKVKQRAEERNKPNALTKDGGFSTSWHRPHYEKGAGVGWCASLFLSSWLWFYHPSGLKLVRKVKDHLLMFTKNWTDLLCSQFSCVSVQTASFKFFYIIWGLF